MLGDTGAIATVAVKELAAARKFYEATLGLEPVANGEPGVQSYKAGSSTLLVYESRYAGTNRATAVTWGVGAKELEDLVRALKGKGVVFEHYDLPGTTRQGDIHVAGKTRVAWFKDPDGNIHSLVTQS